MKAWVPINQKLPDPGTEVLIQTDAGNIYHVCFHSTVLRTGPYQYFESVGTIVPYTWPLRQVKAWIPIEQILHRGNDESLPGKVRWAWEEALRCDFHDEWLLFSFDETKSEMRARVKWEPCDYATHGTWTVTTYHGDSEYRLDPVPGVNFSHALDMAETHVGAPISQFPRPIVRSWYPHSITLEGK